MASGDIKKTVEILFGVTDQTRSGLDSIKSEFQSLDAYVQQAAAPVADLTASLLKAEAAIVATGVAITGLAVTTAGQYQSSIAEVGTLLNLNAEQNAEFSQTLIDYGRNASVALDDIVSASYIAISTGTDLADVTVALSSAEKLAVAGATDLNTATGALSRTLNAYGLSAEEAERVSNALFIAVQNGDTTMAALAGAIGRVASIASASSVSVEDLLSAIAAITVAGVNTNETVTNLAALFKEFAKPTDELKAALGGMNLETNSLQEIMQRLGQVTGGNFAEFTKLFGSIEAVKAAVILANDSTGAFANTLRSMQEDTENLQQAYEVMGETFTRINQNLVNNLRATLIEAGTPLLDDYADSVSALSAVFKALSDGIEAPNFNTVYAALEEFIARFNTTLDGIATALPDAIELIDFSGLIDSFGDLADEVSNTFDLIFGAGLDLSKPEDLAQVLQKVVNGISTLTDITSGVIQSLQPIFVIVGEILNNLQGLDESQTQFAGNIGGSALLLTQFGTALGSTLIYIREVQADIQNVGDVIFGSAKAVINSLQILFDGFVVILSNIGGQIAGALSIVLPDIFGGDEFAKQAEQFNLIGDAAAENLSRNFEEMLEGGRQLRVGLGLDSREAADSVKEVGDAAQESAAKTDDATKVFTGSLSDIKQAAADAGVSYLDLLDKISETGDGTVTAANAAAALKSILEDTAGAAQGSADGLDAAKDSAIKYRVEIDALGNRTLVATDAMQGATKAITDTGESAKKSESNVSELEKTMLELASNERIAALEFTAEIKVAEIQAQAEQVVAAFDSVARSVEATSTATADLFSLLADPNLSLRDKFEISDAAEKQLALQEKALEIQERLVNAQAALMEAQADALQNGDQSIKIEADGLAPELEAIMFLILERIRIKVAGDYGSFLLGTGA